MTKFSKLVLLAFASSSVCVSTATFAAVNDAASDSAQELSAARMTPMGTRGGQYASTYASQVTRSSPAMSAMGPASPTSETAMPKVRDSATSLINK